MNILTVLLTALYCFLPNVLIVSRFWQKHLLNALNVNVTVYIFTLADVRPISEHGSTLYQMQTQSSTVHFCKETRKKKNEMWEESWVRFGKQVQLYYNTEKPEHQPKCNLCLAYAGLPIYPSRREADGWRGEGWDYTRMKEWYTLCRCKERKMKYINNNNNTLGKDGGVSEKRHSLHHFSA